MDPKWLFLGALPCLGIFGCTPSDDTFHRVIVRKYPHAPVSFQYVTVVRLRDSEVVQHLFAPMEVRVVTSARRDRKWPADALWICTSVSRHSMAYKGVGVYNPDPHPGNIRIFSRSSEPWWLTRGLSESERAVLVAGEGALPPESDLWKDIEEALTHEP